MDRQLGELTIADGFGDAPPVALNASENRRVDHELGINDLYDLACHLFLDEREAERMLSAVLRQSGRRAGSGSERAAASISLLVQAYLEQNSPRSRHFNPSLNLVRIRAKSKPLESHTLEARLIELDPQERVCLVLRERVGLSVAEVARITGLERESVSHALFSARERLVAFLPGEDTR